MLAGHTRKGKPIYQVWQINGSEHQLITGQSGFAPEEHQDAFHLFERLALQEVGERGPTEFFHQFRRLQEMHRMYMEPPKGTCPPAHRPARSSRLKAQQVRA